MLGYNTRYYADTYEEVHSGDDVYRYYYIHTPDGLTNVAEKKNSTITVYSAETDYLGSIASLYNRNGQKVFRAEYDAWGKQNVVTDSLARFQRGYCGHEHWREFDLIDMNGRMYDPVIARFLSPDPFVQAPEDLQNYNRYSYCLNNPLKYTDPSGEFWNLVIGAAVGGVINWITNGHEFSWKGFGYFGVGAVAGFVGAGIGAGVSSALAGGPFGAGFVGSASASTASSCFVSGVAIGGSSGFAGGFTTGFGNGLVGGQGFGKSLVAGLKDGFVSGTSGALIGGISSGWKAHRKGDNFFGEKTILEEKVLAETDLTLVKQNGPFDCGFAATESMTGINQSDLANYYSCYNNELVPVIDPKGNDLAKTLNAVSNESWSLRHISQSNIVEQLRQGNKVLVTYTIYDGYNSYGHGVAVKNIIQQKIRTRVGYETTKQIYTIMNPASGGYETLNPKSIEHAFSLLHF